MAMTSTIQYCWPNQHKQNTPAVFASCGAYGFVVVPTLLHLVYFLNHDYIIIYIFIIAFHTMVC